MPAARCTFSPVITQQALLPDASSMFFTPSSRLVMFIKHSGYSILFFPRKWIETMLCSHFPEIPGSLRGLALPGGLEAGPGPGGIDKDLQGGHFSALPHLLPDEIHQGSMRVDLYGPLLSYLTNCIISP